jgi:glucosamine-6-phosphate deaminase
VPAIKIINGAAGPVTARCPVSLLQLHPHATEAAAAQLANAECYRYALKYKPGQQKY